MLREMFASLMDNAGSRQSIIDMENYSFTVKNGEAGQRLDLYLVLNFPKSASRTYLQKLIKQNKVLINGRAQKSHYKVAAGDFIELEIPKPEKIEIRPENIPLDIIYEDEHLMVVNKPAGMVVHPAPGHYSGTLVNALLYHTERLSKSHETRPGIVHRLDKDTSGLLIVAKDEACHSFLARQFNKRTTRKKYIAIVEGVLQLDNGIITYPIARHPRDRKKMSISFSEAKNAVTHYKVLERFKDKTLLEIRPETGRTHQIRVHMAYIGYPVVGDVAYGTIKKDTLIERQALHASEIYFLHPITKKQMQFSSPIPEDMKNLIEGLKTEN